MTTTNDEQTIAQLRAAMADEVRGHHLDREAALNVLRSPRRSRRTYLAATAGGMLAAAAVVVYAVADSDSHHAAPPTSSSCSVQNSVLPTWARAGFTDPKPVMPHVLSDNGKIIAILWSRSHPLNAPPLHDQNNKILWVSPDYGIPLVIHARLGDTTVTRKVAGGPGPSIIDMPRAGCWTFDLSWGGHHDTLRLPYDRP